VFLAGRARYRRLCFWVKLSLLVRDCHDLSLWRLDLSATWFDQLVTTRGALGSLVTQMHVPPSEGW
jgi:hypothetical protein